MEQFYKLRGEKRKTTKAQALQEAQRSLLDGRVRSDDPKAPDLRHLYYWAPFILMGNWL
jgi:CHAT domain-containing protein